MVADHATDLKEGVAQARESLDSGAARARIYGVRYVVSFTVLAATLPLIAIVYDRWGFDVLFGILAAAAFVILCAVAMLPRKLPEAA